MANSVLIVTVYNSENCGSFLQAYAMQKVLENIGYDVMFYYRDAKGTSHELKNHIIKAFKSIVRGNLASSINTFNRWFIYHKLIKRFQICKIKDDAFSEVGTIILGSDTIWNFDSNYFRSNADIFLGNIFHGKKVFSYAASVANTTEEKFCSVLQKHGGLSLNNYLVRDRHTQDCLEKAGICDSSIVCDPSLLIGLNDYSELMHKIPFSGSVMVLYYFGDIPKDIQLSILSFAKSKKLRIVSLLYRRDWCDYSTLADPHDMITYYSCASYVVTNTFHGCAFAINFNIPFAAYDEGKNKVAELLKTYGCTEHLFKNAQDIEGILTRELNVQSVVEVERSKSIFLLKQALQ